MAGSRRENLVLVGMRASGKSTLGRRLAEHVSRPFVDLDEELARRRGQDIDDFLRLQGEEAFRRAEAEVLHWAAGLAGHVIATGGGAVLCGPAFQSLAASGQVIYLEVEATELVRRAALRPRPALTDLPPEDEVRALLQVRDPLYRAAADRIISAQAPDPILAILDR
jgi:shikimate kinase